MKILEIGTGYTPIPAKMGAATEIVVEELTKSFMKSNTDVTIVDIKADDRAVNDLPIVEVSVPKKFSGTDVQLGIMHKLKRIVYSISLSFSLKKIIEKEKSRLILHFHNQYNLYFFLLLTPKQLRKKCYIAYTNHSYIWHGNWDDIKETIKKRYFQEIYAMKNADVVFVLNEHTIDTLVEKIGIEKQKIKLIDNGVNTDVYTPQSQEEINSFKRELGLENRNVFIQIGSVCDRKNQLGSLELLLPILKEREEYVFLYAGGIISKEYQEEIVDFCKKNHIEDKVRYLGELKPGNELNKYYNLADLMVFPSKSEGFSLVIVEAMSAGVPVIINDKLQFKLSSNCLKYSSKDDFDRVVRTKILNKEEQISQSKQAREAVVRNYSWDVIAKDYYQTWLKE